jgi:hypothetical protein
MQPRVHPSDHKPPRPIVSANLQDLTDATPAGLTSIDEQMVSDLHAHGITSLRFASGLMIILIRHGG